MRYRIFSSAYAHLEYAQLNYSINSRRIWVPFLYAGVGYTQEITDNVYLNVLIMYDFLQDINSPYPNEPIYSGGISVGF